MKIACLLPIACLCLHSYITTAQTLKLCGEIALERGLSCSNRYAIRLSGNGDELDYSIDSLRYKVSHQLLHWSTLISYGPYNFGYRALQAQFSANTQVATGTYEVGNRLDSMIHSLDKVNYVSAEWQYGVFVQDKDKTNAIYAGLTAVTSNRQLVPGTAGEFTGGYTSFSVFRPLASNSGIKPIAGSFPAETKTDAAGSCAALNAELKRIFGAAVSGDTGIMVQEHLSPSLQQGVYEYTCILATGSERYLGKVQDSIRDLFNLFHSRGTTLPGYLFSDVVIVLGKRYVDGRLIADKRRGVVYNLLNGCRYTVSTSSGWHGRRLIIRPAGNYRDAEVQQYLPPTQSDYSALNLRKARDQRVHKYRIRAGEDRMAIVRMMRRRCRWR